MVTTHNYFERSATADKRVDSSAFTAFRTKRLRLCQLRFQFFIQSKTNKDKLKKLDPPLDLNFFESKLELNINNRRHIQFRKNLEHQLIFRRNFFSKRRTRDDLHNQTKTFSMSLTMGFLQPFSNTKPNLKIHRTHSTNNHNEL